MKTDCQWFDSNMEAYFSGSLGEDQRAAAIDHLKSCDACAQQVQGLQDLDPIIKQVFQYRFGLAQAGRPHSRQLRTRRLALAAATVVLAALLGAVALDRQTPSPGQVAIQTPGPAGSVNEPKKKDTELMPVQRLNPDEVKTPPTLPPSIGTDAPRAGGPEFAVIDAAGYPSRLEDHRGYVVLVGVWSAKQPETAQNLDRVWTALANNPQVRFFAVASERQDKVDGTSFPVVYNNGSQLLGLKSGEFLLLDKTGARRSAGSLSGNSAALLARIRTDLDQLGIK